jgi:hypothetical protein
MVERKTVALTVNIRYKVGYTGILVGQCKEFPFIIVEGTSQRDITDKIFYELGIYLATFPNEGHKALEKYGEVIQNEEQIDKSQEEGWTQKKIEVPIPAK